jgi:hypothetical protein
MREYVEIEDEREKKVREVLYRKEKRESLLRATTF